MGAPPWYKIILNPMIFDFQKNIYVTKFYRVSEYFSGKDILEIRRKSIRLHEINDYKH